MQTSVSIVHHGQTLRGMEHIPERDTKFPAVILLHGFTGHKLEPHRFFLKISRTLETIGVASFRFDFLGSGESDGDFENMTVLRELDQARAIFQYVKSHPAIDETKITVLGISMGGLVASMLAGELQDELYKLILLAPVGSMKDNIKKWIDVLPFIENYDAYDNGGDLIGKSFFNELETIEVWDKASKFTNPVLIIHGSEDKSVPLEVSSTYIENCYHSNATLRVIDGADHTFNRFEWEREVIETIMEYVENN
jgi:pimeloyl-ACP methyl ester carboxylesterase